MKEILGQLASFITSIFFAAHLIASPVVTSPAPQSVPSALSQEQVLQVQKLIDDVVKKLQTFGAIVPSTPALIDTYLASGIAKTDASMTLANGSTTAGTSLSGTMCFVLDVNTPTVEYTCGTAAGATISGLTRGIDPLNPNTSSTSLAFPHRRFSSVQVSDYPALQFISRILNGTDPTGGVLSYPSGTSNASISTNNMNLVDYGILASTSLAGAVPATMVNAGIVKIATGTDLANGNTTTTYELVAPAELFSSSSKATIVPVTNGSGTLADGFIGQSASDTYNFLGGLTITSPTLNGTTTFQNVPYGIFNYFGNGANGSTTISATTTLTTDMYYTNLTVNARLNTGGFRIFVNGTLSGNTSGTIMAPMPNNGQASIDNTSTPALGATSSLQGWFTNQSGANGGAGGQACGNNNAGADGVSATTTTNSIGNSGGHGGNGQTSGSAGGSGGTASVSTSTTQNFGTSAYSTYVFAYQNPATSTFTVFQQGNGGGGGGENGHPNTGTGSTGGGGGGASGYPIFIAAKTLTGTFAIQALGGNGGNSATNGCGSGLSGGVGGGGAGGNLVMVYQTKTYSGTVSLTGGLKGSVGNTTNATNGTNGVEYNIVVNSFTLP